MKYLNYITICIFTILTFTECTKKKDLQVKTDSFFSEKPEFITEHSIIEIENQFFGNPLNMVLIDSFLIINDEQGNYHFSLIDIKNKKLINRYVKNGKGPQEFGFISNVHINYANKSLNFVTPNPFRHVEYSYMDIYTKKFESPKVTNQEDNSWIMFTLNYFPIINKYLATGQFESGKYGIIDSAANLDYTIGELPVVEGHESADNFTLCHGFQGIVKQRPSGDKMCVVSLKGDLIDVVDSSLNVNRFHSYYPAIRIQGGSVGYSKHTPVVFVSTEVTNNYIYILYSGKTYHEHAMAAEYGNTIYVFDWDLNPICKYLLDKEIRSFSISGEDQMLYSIATIDEDMRLVSWKLNH